MGSNKYKISMWRLLFCIYAIVLSCIAGSCSQTLSDDGSIPVLDIEKGIDNIGYVKLSKYASDINYLPLETTLDCMMSSDEYVSIVKKGDTFYFYSKFGAPVFAFDLKGNFLGTVGVSGRAANEFTRYVISFAANEEKDEVVICDLVGKLLKYDSKGEFKSSALIGGEENSQFGLKIFNATADEYVFLVESYDYENIPEDGLNEEYGEQYLVTVDSDGKILNEQFCCNVRGIIQKKSSLRHGATILKSYLYETDKKFTLISNNDTIYSYNPLDRSVVAEYVVKFGKYLLGGSNPSMAQFNQSDIFFDTENFIIFSAMFPISFFKNEYPTYLKSVFVYDKKSGSIKALKLDEDYGHALLYNGFGTMPGTPAKGFAGFTNDLDGGAPFVPRYIKDGKMYQIMDAIRFMDLAEKSKSQKMKKAAAGLNEDSNPVLIEVVMK